MQLDAMGKKEENFLHSNGKENDEFFSHQWQ
jgi:hypothetical protein